MSKTKRILIYILTFLLIIFIFICGYVGITILNAPDLKLNKDTLNNINTTLTIMDNDNNILKKINKKGSNSIEIDELNRFTTDAFISIEDKNFYEHNGLNYMRIFKSLYNNIKYGYAKEGASTITQQLIKNTHLSNEKTLNRKIKEAYLAKQIEKSYSKKEILNIYLNMLYFGNNIYGIQNASQQYFGHSAKDLSLSESAILAGMIKSPAKYSPINNKENCINRRNIVLNEMLKDKKISNTEYKKAKNENLKIKNECFITNKYIDMVLLEATNILKLSEEDLLSNHFTIHTYYDKNIQSILNKSFKKFKESSNNTNKIISIMDNKNHSIIAFNGTKIDNTKRQCGSLIKPFICYGPAFEYNIMSPLSQINDEPINFDGYKPKNVDKINYGWVSVRKSLEKSLNIPAVKTLNYVGINNAKKFAKNFGIEFDKSDNHLALALGAMKEGLTIQQTLEAYSTLANSGKYFKSSFIRKITDKNNKTIYTRTPQSPKIACKESTAYLLNNILQDCTKYGTAKKIGRLNLNMASKTGTVGTNNTTNLDAWCISYSPEFSIISWCGNTSGNNENNLPYNKNGGTICATSIYDILKELQKEHTFTNFIIPNSIVTKTVDTNALKYEHRLMLSKNTNGISDIFSTDNIPQNYYEKIHYPLEIFYDTKSKSIYWENNPNSQYELYITDLLNNKIRQSYNNYKNFNYYIINDKTNLKYITVFENINSKQKQSNIIEFL